MIVAQARLFVEREIGIALRARWFLAYLIAFLAGGVLLTTFGLGDSAVYGYRGFARAIAGLVQLALLFVPIMALLPAIASLGDERETGALEYLLAQPIEFADVYIGKWLGVGTAVVLAVSVGFGGAGAIAVVKGVPVHVILALWIFLVLLALVFVSLGLCLATLTASRARAGTLGTAFWLLCVAFGTLGVMAVFIRLGSPTPLLVAWSFANPIESFRLGIVSVLDPDLSLLGPLGTEMANDIGALGTAVLAGSTLVLWIGVLLATGWFVFSHWPRSTP